MTKIECLMEVNLEVLIRTSSPEMLIHFKIWVITFLYWPSPLLVELVLINIFLTQSWYGLEQFAAVMASMPGYKPKSTIIWLEETATEDFILDPDITLEGNTLGSICDWSCDGKTKIVLLEFLWGFHIEVCFVLIVIAAFVCFLLKMRLKFTPGKQKQSTKGSVVL